MFTRVIIKGCYHSETSLFPETVAEGGLCTARGGVIGFWGTLQSQGHSVTRFFESALYGSFCFLVTSVSVDAVP